jgi:hypothetical protein
MFFKKLLPLAVVPLMCISSIAYAGNSGAMKPMGSSAMKPMGNGGLKKGNGGMKPMGSSGKRP